MKNVRWKLGVILFDGLTMLDMIGPVTVLEEQCSLHFLYSKAGVKVESDTPLLSVNSTHSFEDVSALDVIVVPGGFGVPAAIKDTNLLKFLTQAAEAGTLMTSVCTGSIILAAAGLLNGYDATTHWMMHEALEVLGARSIRARVVHDRNRITGAGVAAGIDLGLSVLSHLTDDDTAKRRQLQIEYDPRPPFGPEAGNPYTADPRDTAFVENNLAKHTVELLEAAKVIAQARASSNGVVDHTQLTGTLLYVEPRVP